MVSAYLATQTFLPIPSSVSVARSSWVNPKCLLCVKDSIYHCGFVCQEITVFCGKQWPACCDYQILNISTFRICLIFSEAEMMGTHYVSFRWYGVCCWIYWQLQSKLETLPIWKTSMESNRDTLSVCVCRGGVLICTPNVFYSTFDWFFILYTEKQNRTKTVKSLQVKLWDRHTVCNPALALDSIP